MAGVEGGPSYGDRLSAAETSIMRAATFMGQTPTQVEAGHGFWAEILHRFQNDEDYMRKHPEIVKISTGYLVRKPAEQDVNDPCKYPFLQVEWCYPTTHEGHGLSYLQFSATPGSVEVDGNKVPSLQIEGSDYGTPWNVVTTDPAIIELLNRPPDLDQIPITQE